MERTVEPELMEREDQVISYAKADFSESENNLINQINNYLIKNNINLNEKDLIVDLGCGPGNISEKLSIKWPKAIVVGQRFKLLAKKSYEPAKWYSVRILPNIISDLEAGFLNLNDNLAEQLLGLRLNCLHSLEKNDFGFDRIFISLLK